jgi:UDP-glucose:(heptosyl)LPS alpha-1,3-glucosyltransferase
LRFAFVIFKYFPFGGMQRDMLRIASRLSDAGHAVDIFTMQWQGDLPEGHIQVHVLPSCAWSNINRYQHFLGLAQAQIQQSNFDLVLGFNRADWLDVYFGADPCFKERAYTQRSRWYRLTKRYRWFAGLEKAIFGRTSDTQILLLSEQEKVHFQHWYGTPDSRLHYVPPYLPKQRFVFQNKAKMRAYLREVFHLQADDVVFLLVGSGFFMKGLDRAIKGLASLPEDLRAKVKLIAIGQDKPAPMLKLAQQHGVAQQLIISAGRSDIPQLMQGADVYLHPAHRENTGLVILEAMACGLPVLTTASTGYARYVTLAQAGLVVPQPFQQQDLNQAMLAMLTTHDLAQFGQAGRKFALDVMRQNDGNAEANILIQLAQQRASHKSPFASVPFAQMMQLQGEYFRNLPQRKTLRVQHQGASYFVKQHFGIGYREILKNLLSMKWPIVGAKTEARAIRTLQSLGIATTPLVGFASQGINPARQQSYLITRDLGQVQDLEKWLSSKQKASVRQQVITQAIQIVDTLHRHFVYHQDLYLCHFCIDLDTLKQGQIKLSLIDLHRCRILSRANRRAALKDMAALMFSAMDAGFSQQDMALFNTHYSAPDAKFWQDVQLRAERLYNKFHSTQFQQRLAQERARLTR